MFVTPLIVSIVVALTPHGYKDWLDNHLTPSQAACAKTLWVAESQMDSEARNDTTGAYGIPQALPGDKMASAGDDWRTNGYTQMRWGLKYVNERYSGACNALEFWNRNGWY